MRGDAAIVSAFMNKIKDQVGDLMPDTLRAKQLKKEHEPVDPTKKSA
jgi:hypothetical protein